jgi:hypothetical protein
VKFFLQFLGQFIAQKRIFRDRADRSGAAAMGDGPRCRLIAGTAWIVRELESADYCSE